MVQMNEAHSQKAMQMGMRSIRNTSTMYIVSGISMALLAGFLYVIGSRLEHVPVARYMSIPALMIGVVSLLLGLRSRPNK
jgi:hypothetical protein